MPKVRLKYPIQDINETLYKVEINFHRQEERTITKRPHRSSGKSSEAQKAHRRRFKEAVAYAKAAIAEPGVRVIYEKRAAKEHRTPYRIAFSDYMHGKNLLLK